ncbi:hypothetical protein J2744_002177 [Halorubrum trapanicum]|uniref:Uncharacterized protein n=1 Tax=Halorubrum trapanicum TaxID=29284 RepID=A0A8J7RWU2_9EURY|nr:hypothetical protein [Halorubrum trapanicum]
MSNPYAQSQLACGRSRSVGGLSVLLILAGVVSIADSRDNQRLGDRFGHAGRAGLEGSRRQSWRVTHSERPISSTGSELSGE